MDTRYIEVQVAEHSDRVGVLEVELDRLNKKIEELKDACDRFEETIVCIRDQHSAEKTLP